MTAYYIRQLIPHNLITLMDDSRDIWSCVYSAKSYFCRIIRAVQYGLSFAKNTTVVLPAQRIFKLKNSTFFNPVFENCNPMGLWKILASSVSNFSS